LAHDSLVSSSPADGSTVTAAPTQVSLTFDEDAKAPSVIVVSDPDGARVQRGQPQIAGKTVSTAVQATKKGVYTVAFRVVSVDGHPVSGEIKFTYAGAGSVSGTSTASTAPAAGHEHHHQQGGVGNGWIVGGLAGAALIGGLALLMTRRRAIVAPQGATGEDSA
ncbi:MAG: copper resistance CopC family protein, partial [Mycobacteriales bacterium]